MSFLGVRLPVRRWSSAWLVTLVLMAGGVGQAQLLADVLVTAAIAAELNPAIRLPSGSFRAQGEGLAPLIARVADAARWRNWEAYTARGLAASLQAAFVQQLATSFAVAGFFENDRSESSLGPEIHTRMVFTDGTSEILLFVIRTQQEVVWLIAESG